MPSELNAAEFRPMWTTEKDDWCLLRLGTDRYLPARKEPLSALVIEDDDLARFVIDQMLCAGCEIRGVRPDG